MLHLVEQSCTLQAIGWLLSVPGASETILEVSVPYSRISMMQLLGKMPLNFESKETAEDIATAAYNRALKLSIPGVPVVGLGFTAALATAVPKRGNHRCHVCARTQDHIWNYEFVFTKGLRNREEEDFVSSQLLIRALAFSSGVSMNVPVYCQGTENIKETNTDIDEDSQIRQLLEGKICMLPYPHGTGVTDREARRVILSGSFNPLHEGHLKLMDSACNVIPGAPVFEISVINADKPPLAIHEIKSRVKQFKQAGRTVVLTNQPFFFKKAEVFPNSTFVVGADTAVRLVNPKYYDGSRIRMLEALFGMQNLGCDFVVAGRMMEEKFLTLSDSAIPDEVEGMFKEIPTKVFRMDVSSTELRKRKEAGDEG